MLSEPPSLTPVRGVIRQRYVSYVKSGLGPLYGLCAPAVSACTAGDANGDGEITIDEIITAVRNALSGC